MFILGLEEGFDEEPDEFMDFFYGFVFGDFDGVNLVADLLVEMVAPEFVDGLDEGLDIFYSVEEGEGLEDYLIGIRFLKLFKVWDDIVHVKAIRKLLNGTDLVCGMVENVEVLQVGWSVRHE